MKWYYQQAGGHTHVRVFMNGGKWIQFIEEAK